MGLGRFSFHAETHIMCHTMIIGAATVVIALLAIGGAAYVADTPPTDIHAASASIDVMQLTKEGEKTPER